MPTISKVERHRAKLRAAGLRPIQMWVPDTRIPEIAHQLQQQCRQLKNDPAEHDMLGFVEAAAAQPEGWQ